MEYEFGVGDLVFWKDKKERFFVGHIVSIQREFENMYIIRPLSEYFFERGDPGLWYDLMTITEPFAYLKKGEFFLLVSEKEIKNG